MTATALVHSEILRFLTSDSPEVLCVTGEWGIGKTYTWQRVLNQVVAQKTLKLTRYSYVSLFGVNSLEGLKFAIFENMTFPAAERHGRHKKTQSRLPNCEKVHRICGGTVRGCEIGKKRWSAFFLGST